MCIQQMSTVRTCGLILLVTALGGAWSVEQPNGSLLEFYPLWRETIQHIFECGHEFSVRALSPICGATMNHTIGLHHWP